MTFYMAASTETTLHCPNIAVPNGLYLSPQAGSENEEITGRFIL